MPVSLDDLWFFNEPIHPFLSIEEISWPNAENMVSTVFFNTKINLNRLVGLVGAVSYRSPKLTAVTIRFHEHGAARAPSAQIFGSGMVVYMGATSETITLYYVHITRIIFSQLGLEQEPRNGRLFTQNMVYSGCHHRCLDIVNFEKHDRIGTVSSNKSFPGIVYLAKPPGCSNELSFSLFESGRYNVMKLHPDEMYTGFFHVLRVLQRNSSDRNIREHSRRCVEAVRKALLQRNPMESLRDTVTRALISVEESYDAVESIPDVVSIPEPKIKHRFVIEKPNDPKLYVQPDTSKIDAIPLGRKRSRREISVS